MNPPSHPPTAAAEERALRLACARMPRHPAAHAELGRWLMRQARHGEAAEAFGRAVALAPDWPPALVALGVAQAALGQAAAAEANYRRALACDPRHAVALRNLRMLLVSQERHGEAVALAEAALAAGTDPGEAHLSRGTALFALGRFPEALAALEAAQASGADRYEVLTKISAVRSSMGDNATALALLDEAEALKPQEALAPLRRALIRLLTCDFEGGWRDYESRFRNEPFLAEAGAAVRQVAGRLTVDPRPEDVRGRRILAVAEQGIGDQVMFASMLPDLARDAAAVTCVCDPRLARLFAHSFPQVRVLAFPEARVKADEFDAILALGSLGRLYRNRRADYPGAPYLKPRQEVRERWAARLGPRPQGLRIGLSWRGGTARTRTSERSVSLDQLAPILDLPGCEFVSLQYGDVAAEVARTNARRRAPIRLFPAEEIDDFEDLGGLVACVDAVVSVQTALVHLTGALGIPALTLIPTNAEWRYTAAEEVMPWYGSVRLFRQGADQDWTPVIARAAEVLRERGRL